MFARKRELCNAPGFKLMGAASLLEKLYANQKVRVFYPEALQG